jgi:Spy/CpxP family protein refolding chaperone
MYIHLLELQSMKRICQVVIVLVLAAVVATPLMAQKKRNRKPQLPAALRKAIEKVDLTSEQQAKIDALVAEYGPKLADSRLERAATKKRADALKKARAEGKKGKAAQEAANAVLSDKQKESFAKFQELNAALRNAVVSVLTDQQRTKAGLKKTRARTPKKTG